MQQKRSKARSPEVVQGRESAHWCSLGAALGETGWPWLRLLTDLVAGRLFYRTWPPGREINWTDPNLRVDRAESTVTAFVIAPPGTEAMISSTTVAVEVLLPVGERPSAALIKVKASWRDRAPKDDLKAAMEKIAQFYDGKPLPPFDEVWTSLKAIWPDIPRDTARAALRDYAPQLKRQPGETSDRIKSRK